MTVRTLTIGGGSWSTIVETPEAISAAHVQYLDAADQVGMRTPGRRVAVFPIANGQTAASLAKSQSNQALRKHTRRSGNTHASAGLSGSRLVGFVAAQHTIAQQQFQQFLNSSRATVTCHCAGSVTAVEDNGLFGSGGGVGGGAGRPLHRAKVADLLMTGMEVRDHIIRLGPMAHTGVRTDDAIVRNAAATVCEDIYYHLCEGLLSPFETRELTLVECPPDGPHELQRDYHAGTLAQALLCSQVRDSVTAQTVNGTNNLKSVSIVQPAWYGRVKPSDIEKTGYAKYSPQVKHLKKPAKNVRPITLLPISTSPKNRAVVSPNEFLTMVATTAADLPTLLGVAAQSPVRYRVKAEVRLESGKVGLRKLDRYLNSFSSSFADFTARRDFVEGLLPEVTCQLVAWQGRKATARRQLKAALVRLAFVLVWSYARGGIFSRLVSSAQLARKKAGRLRKHQKALRTAATLHAEATAVARLLARARKRLLEERRRIQHVILNVDASLDSFEPFRPLRHPPVEMASLQEAWTVLTSMRPNADIANAKALVQLARRVTAHGLQTILQARDYDAASLAHAVASAKPTEGPHWGNDGATRHYHTTFYVLPPLPESLQSQLEEHSFGTGTIIKFADSCAAGVTAVRLKISTPHDTSQGGLQEIFTPQLRAAFKETISRTHREEHYPQGDAPWQWLAPHLGIRLPTRNERLKGDTVMSNGATSSE